MKLSQIAVCSHGRHLKIFQGGARFSAKNQPFSFLHKKKTANFCKFSAKTKLRTVNASQV